MPQPAQLPESLKNFVFLNAAPVDTGRDFREHIERLIRSIEQISPDRGAASPAASGPRDEAAPPAAPARGDRVADPKQLGAILTADLIRLRGFFNLRALGTIVCIAIVAAVLPRSLAPFLPFREKDNVALNMSQAPAADSRALAASPTAQAASLIGEPIFFKRARLFCPKQLA